MNFLDKYFKDDVEHPANKMTTILPWNILWCYISSTFLNGFINYVNIIDGFLLSRYLSWDDWEDQETIYIRDPAGNLNWTHYKPKSKLDAYNIATQKGRLFHTKLRMFQDDVLILSEIDVNKYCFFWFDCDVSDCFIGRFKSKNKKDTITSDFQDYCFDIGKDLSKSYLEREELPKQLPKHFFSGWLKF